MIQKNVRRIIGFILFVVISVNCSMGVYAKSYTYSGQLLDYALDNKHPAIIIDATTDIYPQEYMDIVGTWAVNAFKSWAFDNLKNPQSVILNQIEVSLFSYQLAYPDMNESYTGYINDLMVSGIEPETIQSIGYVVRIDYSAQNSFGGYVRDTVYGGITTDGTGYKLGKLTLDKGLISMCYYCFCYSGNPIMRWK